MHAVFQRLAPPPSLHNITFQQSYKSVARERKKSRGSKNIKSQIFVNLSKTFYYALLFKLAAQRMCARECVCISVDELCLREKQTGKCELSGKVINLLLHADGIA